MIGNNLKFCREDLEMTQKELGNILGVTEATVSNWENANDSISLKKLVMFCNKYDFSLDYVIGLSRRNINYSTKIDLNKQEIGKKLKEIRKKFNLTQTKFANKAGLPQITYSHYETGRNLITATNLYAICKTYNISMDYVIRNNVNLKLNV